MTQQPVISEKDPLRRAVSWLAKQPVKNAEMVEEACVRFDLCPVDEEFLLTHFVEKNEGK